MKDRSRNIQYSIYLIAMLLMTGGLVASSSCSSDTGSDTAPEVNTNETPVYVTFYSHNEEGGPWNSYVNDATAYQEYRADLIARVNLLASHGAVLNWETAEVVLAAMALHETGALLDETNGKNILRWMTEDMSMVIDPHGHQQTHSFADIAYLTRQMGAEVSGVAGGFVIYECGDSEGKLNVTDWESILGLGTDGLIHGRIYPSETWQPRVLAQPAMAGHTYDEFSSGVWKPGSSTEFFTHQPGGSLPYVGQGYPHDTLNIGSHNSGGAPILYTGAGYVKELVNKIANNEVPSGAIYTASIHLRDCPRVGADVPSTYEGLRQTLEELEPLVQSGRVVYLDYESVAELWRTRYGAEPNRLEINQFSIWSDVQQSLNDTCWSTGEVCGAETCPADFVCETAIPQCVPDCRLATNICPTQLPVCDAQTGLCGP